MKKFAVLNPLDGTYVYTDNEIERDKLIVEAAFKLYISHVHDNPYAIVEITEDGKESWVTPKGEYTLNPNGFEEFTTALHDFLGTEQTPVVTVP